VPGVTEGLVVLLAMPPTGYSPLYCQMHFPHVVHGVYSGSIWCWVDVAAGGNVVCWMMTVMTPTSPVARVDWRT